MACALLSSNSQLRYAFGLSAGWVISVSSLVVIRALKAGNKPEAAPSDTMDAPLAAASPAPPSSPAASSSALLWLCFWLILFASTRPTLNDLYIFHLNAPSWFGKLSQVGSEAKIDVIKFMGPEPEKDVLDKSLADAGLFAKDYFAKKI